jgi:hypothetical protein
MVHQWVTRGTKGSIDNAQRPGRGSMMRPTINEEFDCRRKKNLRRRRWRCHCLRSVKKNIDKRFYTHQWSTTMGIANNGDIQVWESGLMVVFQSRSLSFERRYSPTKFRICLLCWTSVRIFENTYLNVLKIDESLALYRRQSKFGLIWDCKTAYLTVVFCLHCTHWTEYEDMNMQSRRNH